MFGLDSALDGALGAMNNVYYQQLNGLQQQQHMPSYGTASIAQEGYGQMQLAKEGKVATETELLPDISLTRVIKWGIVLIIAMALGRRVWEMFGPKIEANIHKALGVADKTGP